MVHIRLCSIDDAEVKPGRHDGPVIRVPIVQIPDDEQ